MASYYPSKRLSEWAAASLSPYIKLENEGGDINNPPSQQEHAQNQQGHGASSLSVGLWSGNVELKNVELRPEAFEKFLNRGDNADSTVQIKWKLIQGSIESVKIQIPWKSLLVGSAYSSSKYFVPESGETSQEEGNTRPLHQLQGDEEEEAPRAGCTSVHIQGVKVLIGYDIIHRDPVLNALQCQNQQNRDNSRPGESAQPPENEMQEKIREEKNRILQIAERRLLAGLDPFPPSLMAGMQSIMASSIQSGMQSAVEKSASLQPNKANASNVDNSSFDTSKRKETAYKPSSYLSRMENYLSSTIKSLLWRVFDSLSLSVTQVQLSVAGCSHYDKDFVSILKREHTKTGEKAQDKKTLQQQQQQQQQEQQHHQFRQKKNLRKGDFRRHLHSTFDRGINEAHPSHRRASPKFGKRRGSTKEEESAEENIQHVHNLDDGSIKENPSIWSREGQVEVGLTMDQFDVRPGPLPRDAESCNSEDSADVIKSGPSALKLMRFRGVGVFLRKKHSTKLTGDSKGEDYANADAEGVHIGKTLVWNDMKDDDYIVAPANMEASCKVYHNSSTVGLGHSSPQKNEGGSLDALSKTSTSVVTSGSKDTATTRRRGKRDKRQTMSVGTLEANSLPASSPLKSDLKGPAFLERPRQSVISSTEPSTSTASRVTRGIRHRKRAHVGDDSFSLPHRLELSLEMGHVRSSVSPRQIFLIHSLSSSMTRMIRGRPLTTIRAAMANDKTLLERMAEDGEPVIAWEEHIYKELPSLRSKYGRQSRSLPGVVSSWWKYAYLNVVNEIQQRKILLDQCRGDSASTGRRKHILSRFMDSRRTWDWVEQSRIRREYINLYLHVHVSSAGQMSSPTDEAAVAAAKLRLEQLEDKLSVERTLLLKNVARAASIRSARDDGISTQTPKLLSPAEMYYCFPPNSHSKEVVDGSVTQHQRKAIGPLSSFSPPPMAPGSRFWEVGAPTATGSTVQDSTVTGNSIQSPVGELSFSSNLFLSGFSLELCEFHGGRNSNKAVPEYGNTEQFYQPYHSDDISVLTGFSEDDDSKTPKQGVGDIFDPLCRFWPATRHGLYCEQIFLLQISNIKLSAQSHVESELLVGGISIQGGLTTQQNMFSLGNIEVDEPTATTISLLNTPLRTNVPCQHNGISGHFSGLNDLMLNVAPAEIIVDWGWLEKLLRFASENKDIEPSRVTVPLGGEDLLVRAFSNHQKKTSADSTSFILELAKLTLTIPVHHATANDEKAKLFIVTTANNLVIKTGNPCDSLWKEPDEHTSAVENDTQPNMHLHPSQNALVVLDGLDTVIVSEEVNDSATVNSRTSTPLLHCPVSIQLQYSSGQGICSLEQQSEHLCQSYDIRSSPINILISDFRLRTIVEMLNTASNAFVKGGDATESRPLPQSFMPFLAECALEETKVFIQALGIEIISDYDKRPAKQSLARDQLEDIVAAFISQLSCLDFKHPSQNAIVCMTRLMINRCCCALGLSMQQARTCTEVAKANFEREASATFFSAPSYDAKKSRRSRRETRPNRRSTRHQSGTVSLENMNPETLSGTLNRIVRKATAMTVSELTKVLPRPDFVYPEHELAIDADSLVVTRSLFYCGNMVQINAKSLTIRNGKFSLLNIHPHISDVQASPQLSMEEKKSPDDETDVGLTILLRDRVGDCNRNHRNIYFEGGSIESIFTPEAYMDAVEACKAAFVSESGAQEDQIDHPNRPVSDIIVNGNISSFSIVLTDKLLPFIECRFEDIAIEKSVEGGHQAVANTSFNAGTISLDCLWQSNYPNIISTYESRNGESFDGRSVFSIKMTAQQDPTRGPNELLIGLDGVRIVLLRQVLNEILQYTGSPNRGIGLFLSSIESEKGNDDPSKLNVMINNSTFVLPRDKTSVDMVGVEVEEISITRERAVESWSIDKYSFSDVGAAQSIGKGEQFASSSSSDIFFDCADQYQPSASNSPLSPQQDENQGPQTKIPRFTVRLKGAHIFTALNKNHFSTEKVNMPELNTNVQNTGRAKHDKPPFTVSGKMSRSLAENLKSRRWEKITDNPLNLGIKADYAPNLRLLIEDISVGDYRGVSLDMRMSQFYLLMSAWFSNMQELPVFFPFEESFVEECSTLPDPPLDWPEYGTSDFVKRLKCGGVAKATFEMALCLQNLSLRCSYDDPGYFEKVPQSMQLMQSVGVAEEGGSNNFISVELSKVVCSITLDDDSLQRIGIGATSIELSDGRQSKKAPKQGISAKDDHSQTPYVELDWGLDCGRHTLVDGLPLPFQVTVFMTPDQHCLINLGMDMAEAALADLTPIWILLDYFGLFFKEAEYGHPAFEAEDMFAMSRSDTVLETANECDDGCLNIDFRLWMIKPHVIIPSSSELLEDPCVMVEAAGLYYRYKSFGENWSSQDIVAKDLGIVVLREYLEASLSRGLRQVSGSLSSCGVKTLVDGLSFSLRYDYNESTNYTRFALRVPLTSHHFDRHEMDGIESSNIEAQPFSVPPPLVCKPFVALSRTMGNHETSIYLSHEYMKLALDLLSTFVGPSQQDHPPDTQAPGNDNDDSAPQIFSVTAHVEKVKCVISDPVMGMHRPILSVCLPSLLLTASQFQEIEPGPKTKIDQLTGRGALDNTHDMQASMEATVFIDYFKLGLTRNWEPFVEPFKCLIMYEKSSSRGKGITFSAECPLHLNVTGALVETMDDAIKTFDLFRSGNNSRVKTPLLTKRCSSDSGTVKSVSVDDQGNKLIVLHSSAEQLDEDERIAFSLKNNTGERVRVHTRSALESDISSSQTTIAYLDHLHLMPLSFPATATVIKNLQSVEVPFEGDQNIRPQHLKQSKHSTSHEIDLQIPGFQWVRDISFDKAGKHFIELIPRSLSVQSKINEDWRLKNALHILAEVNSVNGGRRLTITSPFEVVNKTDHPICLAISPDPRHSPQDSLFVNLNESDIESRACSIENDGFEIDRINPDEVHSISYLLLESALRLKGNHLGSMWIRPDKDKSRDLQGGPNSGQTIGYPSRPIQLAKILHETSVIFKDSNGDPGIANQVASGVEVSCPIFDGSKNRTSRPFCYVLELKRSPLVRSSQAETVKSETASAGDTLSPGRMGKGLKNAKNIFSKNNTPGKTEIHAPIAYSLIVHPPIIIENLLPERGRFELMDAASKHVLWWGCLEAGERVPVHSVGLDAPLLLLVNLGFCRTTVGEGALIHHGGGDGMFKAGWNSIGSAMKTSKDRVKRTLSTMTESKDNRGAKRVSLAQAGNMKKNDATARHNRGQLGFNTENDMIECSGGGLYRRGDGFGVEDIATELSVTDSLGQRLTLLIDNVLGSGGQRRVSLYCPFWIVNTTEHALRYKQEKAQSYVSGTVLSSEKDGSKPVDGSYRNDAEEDDDLTPESNIDSLNTVFSGRAGALSLLNAINDNETQPAVLAALISEDLPLRVISKLAFMFNFQDILLGGSPRLCIQLADTRSDSSRYTSAWSSGFGLESVGVTQIVGMHCKDGRGLEVSVSISIAPGRLSNYTKIVRICPRYLVVNQLPCPIRLWQDNSILHPNLPIEESPKDAVESRKWMFDNGQDRPDGLINQYELLFGSPTVIDRNEDDIGMDEQTTAHHDACYIATVRPSELVAFHLPDTRLERLLRVDLGSSWYLSPSFAADITGEYVLAINKARDLRMLSHVSSRGAPVYTVTLPPNNTDWSGELGVWFETDWGRDRKLIVKGIREGSYASYFSDIIVGDELIMIDAIPVEQLTFDEAMKYLKVRLAAAKEAAETRAIQSPIRPLQLIRTKTKKRILRPRANDNNLTLTFITLEERLRILRRAAVSKEKNSTRNVLKDKEMLQTIDHSASPEQGESTKDLLVDMKYLFQSVFVFLRAPDPKDPPYRVINRSLHWVIYYRQRACDSHPWKCLSPGESSAYTWEEPMKATKLSVRVGVGEWINSGLNRQNSLLGAAAEKTRKPQRPLFSFQFIENEEQGHFGAARTVKLEEIGYMGKLPCPARGDRGRDPSSNKKETSLQCQVDTEGATIVLVVSDALAGTQENDETLVRRNLSNIRKEISFEVNRRSKFDELNTSLVLSGSNVDQSSSANNGTEVDMRPLSTFPINESTSNPSHCELSETVICNTVDSDAIESELQDIVDYDEGTFITKCNQVVVEVLEATGLRSSDLNGLSNPYVKVGLFCGNKKKYTGSFRRKKMRSTYYVEKTLSPQWSHQSFVFDVPAKASSDPRETRRYSISCVIKGKENLGKDKFLGQAHIHLRNLKDQKENVGWYPLMGKLGQGDTGQDPLDRICGSIRLRVQWVYNYSGLMEHYLLCSDRRLDTLRRSKDGMKRQLKSLQDAAKQKKMEERSDSISVSRVPALAAIYKRKKGISVEPDQDGKENAKEEISKRLRARNMLKRNITAVMMAAKVQSKAEVEMPTSLAMNESVLDSFDQDGSSSDDTSDDTRSANSMGSGESLDDDAKNASSSHSPGLFNGDNSMGEAGPTQITLFLSDSISAQSITYSHPYTTNAHRLLCLRWQSWEHYTNNTLPLATPPFYPSWNISRAFVNGNVTKPERSRVIPPAAHEEVQTDEPGVLLMTEFLKLPIAAPHLIAERENNHVRELMHSRASFSKAARRSLGSILNPGGVLTIRPITALNLPETFTGMFVKLRYGNKICLSETVDSKVSPVWTDEESLHVAHANLDSRNLKRSMRAMLVPRQSSLERGVFHDFNDIAEMVSPTRAWGLPRKNDLTVEVDAFETSKSLRITVIGERLQSKVELGVLEIPLGPALECCAQSIEDYDEDRKKLKPKGLPPAYARWFPLMSPSEAVPIEGDMGKSIRPLESEKLNDNMFAEYFAPCIKLALMFQPNVDSDDNDAVSASRSITDQYMYARLDRISAALIDSSRIMELLSFSSRDADLRISVTSAKTRLGVAVGHVQLDQQSSGINTKVPVILAPTPVKLPQPTVQFLAWKDNIRSKSDMDSYEYVAIQVQEMDLKIEESWLYVVWEFYLDVMKKREARANLWYRDKKNCISSSAMFEVEESNADAIDKASIFLKEDKKLNKKTKIYVRELILGFMKVNLSYFKSPKSSWGNPESLEEAMVDADHLDLFPSSNGQPGQDVYRQWSENSMNDADERSQYANINIISAVFPSISEAPIRFNGRLLNHVYESEGDIWRSLKSFYSAEALKQIYKIVGSLDFVGNPTMVLTSFRTGLRDFFLQPSRELKHITKNPSRFGVGVLKGTLSLLSNSASGVFGFASNLGATVGHTATMLTLDEDFQRLHSEQKAAQQRHYDRWKKKGFGHVTLMVTRPVHDIVFGVVSASTGLLTEPYRGAKKDGVVGCLKGTSIGVIGVFVKPIVGVSDAFSHLMEGFHDIAKSANLLESKFKPIERYRLPYIFTTKQMLLPFSQVDSRSAQLLLAHPVDKKTRKGEEVIVASETLHMGNGLDHYVVVTTTRVVLFRLKVVDGQGFVTVNLVWQARYGKGARITSSLGNRGHNGSILYVSRYTQDRENLFEANDSNHSLHNTTLEESSRMNNDQHRQSDYLNVEGEGKYPNPETPKSFYPLGPTTAAFRLRTSWPFAAPDGEEQVSRFAVEGSFLQRTQLSRIHNAICCLSGDFDSITFEGTYRSEGVTSFGPLIFERPQQRLEPLARNDREDLSSLYSSLEKTTWKCDGLQFSVAPRNIGLNSAPSWLVESRARGMLVPPPPVLPSNVDPTRDEVVCQILSELDHGLRTSETASRDIFSHAQSLHFQKIKQGLAENEYFLRHSRLGVDNSGNDADEDHIMSSSFPISIASSESKSNFDDISVCEHDSFINEGPSVEVYGASPLTTCMTSPTLQKPSSERLLIEETPLQESHPVIDESLIAIDSQPCSVKPAATTFLSAESAPGYSTNERSSLDERLQRVEGVVEALLGCDSSTANLSHSRWPNTPTQIDQPSSASSINHFYAPTPNTRSHNVNDLLKEIDELKKQLAAKDNSAASNVHTEAPPSVNETSEIKPRNKLRGRIKTIFRGKRAE